jgi:hypothetical protein
MSSSRTWTPRVVRIGMPPTTARWVSVMFVPDSVRVSSCSTCEPYLIPSGWKDAAMPSFGKSCRFECSEYAFTWNFQCVSKTDRYCAQAITRWLAPPCVGSTESQRLMQLDPE